MPTNEDYLARLRSAPVKFEAGRDMAISAFDELWRPDEVEVKDALTSLDRIDAVIAEYQEAAEAFRKDNT